MISHLIDLINLSEDCRILPSEEIQKIDSLNCFKYVIEVRTQVSIKIGCYDVILYVAIPDPPITLPKIFIDETSYNRIKFIPHINKQLNICIYDEGINHVFNPAYLPQIVEEMICRAKQIIRQFDAPQQILIEFEREFKAYWEISYEKNDIVSESGLSIIIDKNISYKVLYLKTPLNGYRYLLYQESCLFDKFKSYLELRNIQTMEIEVFEIDYDRIKPPFQLSFSDSIKYIKQKDLKKFKKTVNNDGINHVLIFFKNNLVEYYGWVYNKTIPPKESLSRGFRRPIKQWDILTGSSFSKSLVQRIIFSEITPNRLDKRTSGYPIENKISVCIVGLGSVGSNLLNFLIKLPINRYYLVDSDILKLENIFRYQYGLDYIGTDKVEIAKWNILNKNPFCDVTANKKSIVDILILNSSIFTEFDLNIIAVGNTMLEKYLLDHLIITQCKRPVIILWIEPYMASGQMLYILPEDYMNARNLLDKFPFRVLDNSNELNVYLKEGSCQSGYYPYSESNLTLFLSSVFPYLYEFVCKKLESSSKVITWVGDKNFLQNQKLNFSEFGKNNKSFQTIINDLLC